MNPTQTPDTYAINQPPGKCPKCGAPEIASSTPRTTYACGASDYDQRPGTFKPCVDTPPVAIARLRELLAKATPEVWYCSPGDSAMIFSSYVKGVLGTVTKKEDAYLIIALRNATPALLDEIERLRDRNTKLLALVEEFAELREDSHGRYYVSKHMGGINDALSSRIDALLKGETK